MFVFQEYDYIIIIIKQCSNPIGWLKQEVI